MNSKLNFLIIFLIAGLLVTACKSRRYSAEIYRIPKTKANKSRSIPPPPGMAYVPSGTIMDKTTVIDTSLAADTTRRSLTLSAFFMDIAEVSNVQYRTFVDWVADSLVITDYLKDPKYFVAGKSRNAKVPDSLKRINWNMVKGHDALWKSRDPKIQQKVIGKLVLLVNGRPTLNREMVKYTYTYLAFDNYGRSRYVKESVPVFPDTKVWSEDFPNSQMDVMSKTYYENRNFDNYPVVGVNWKQARAYADWRGRVIESNVVARYGFDFTLPTEAQWMYAASYGVKSEDLDKVRSFKNKKKKNKEMLVTNFKQQEGAYALDGATFTVPVRSYAPNSLGIYNLQGNVAEWTLDAFSPSARELVHDLNPVLLYDASDNDGPIMKRKVVRGGSWKDNAKMLSVATRSYEIQDQGHSYLGFRCILPAPDLLNDQVKTRKFFAIRGK